MLDNNFSVEAFRILSALIWTLGRHIVKYFGLLVVGYRYKQIKFACLCFSINKMYLTIFLLIMI